MKKLVVAILTSSFIYSQCLGDVNDDYTVNVQDVVIMISAVLYDDEIDYDVADINDDGSIDILDIISLMNIILYENNPCTPPIDIIYNIHESLPIDWVTEFYIIMDNLTDIIPANQNYFEDLNIYAWNSNVEDPYPGIQGGSYVGGSDQGFYMVLEINELEFEWNHMHRYSVIAHEYFHIYQLSINEPMNEPNGGYNPNTFSIKWLIEGTATTFESIYIQEYYDYNYFTNELAYTNISDLIHTDPSIFESYNSNNIDINYTSSVFMVLVLAKELIELGHSEDDTFKMIFKEFMLTGAKNSDWENFFLDIFGFSVDDFYDSLQSYTLNLEDVIPSSSLSLQQIFD
tara:strand:+ start:34 stop:1065 length:1032 start_codon:yes stop_codon:yes gene_type:complete